MDILKIFKKKHTKNVKKKFTKLSLSPNGLEKAKKYLEKMCITSPAYSTAYKRAFFSVFKDIEVSEAVKVGEEVISKEPDPAFIRVLAARHKRIGNTKRAKELLLNISNRDYYINTISLKSLTSTLESCKTDKEIKTKIEEILEDFPKEKIKIYEYIFAILKDSHPDIAIKYGKMYFQENPKNFKFTNILLKRLEKENDIEGIREVEKNKKQYNLLKKLKKGQLFSQKHINFDKYKNELKVISKKLEDIHIEEYIDHVLEIFPEEHVRIHETAFAILKKDHPNIATQYGKAYLKKNPHDSKFGRFLKNNIQKTPQKLKEKNELEKLKEKPFCKGKQLDEKKFGLKLESISPQSSEHFLNDFIDFLIHKFPQQKDKIYEISFSKLKDTHTELAVKFGCKHINKNPENIKFAKVVIKRLERLGLKKEMLATVEDVLKYNEDPDLRYLLFHEQLKDDIAKCEQLYLNNDLDSLNNKLTKMESSSSNKVSFYREIFKFYAKKDYHLAESYALKSLELKYNEYLIKELYDLHIGYGSISKALSVLPQESTLPTLEIKKSNGNSLIDLYNNGFDLPKKEVSNYIPEDNKIFYLLHNRLPYNSGGYATRSHGLLTGVAKYGWSMNGVSRLGYPWDKMPDKKSIPKDIIDGIDYHRLLDKNIGLGKLPLKNYLEEYAQALLEIAIKEKPVMIHAASNYMNGIVGNYVAKCLGIKSVYEVRGLWEITRISRQPEWKDTEYYNLMVKMEAEAAKGADSVLTLTQALKDEMISRGVDANKIEILPNGVTSDRFIPRTRNIELEKNLGVKDKIVIGYIGSVVAYEGLELLVDAVRLLVDKNIKNIAILIVGDGAVLDMIQDRVQENNLEKYFIFTGRVPHEEVEEYYSLVDITPFPRKGQPVCEMVSPLKPFEAMAMEKAVVSSNVAALAEIVQDGYNGLLFEKDNIQDLAEKLERLVSDKDLRTKLGQQSREWVIEKRDWKVISNTLHEVYTRLLQGNLS